MKDEMLYKLTKSLNSASKWLGQYFPFVNILTTKSKAQLYD